MPANGAPATGPAVSKTGARATATTAPAAIAGNVAPLWQLDGISPWMIRGHGLSRPYLSLSSPARGLLDFDAPGFASGGSGSVAYTFDSGWSAHADISQESWFGAALPPECGFTTGLEAGCASAFGATPRLVGSRVGATYLSGPYRVGMDVSHTYSSNTASLLPRVVPNVPMAATIGGLPFYSLDDSTSLNARGRIAVGSDSGIDMGASVGRIRLLPGNILGVHALNQRSLSLGLDSGPVSGRIVGRLMEPDAGGVSSHLPGADDSWTSIDLGVTWRLPWQGSLSFGAQNVWSSGHAPKTRSGSQLDQSSIPYVQYHQDF